MDDLEKYSDLINHQTNGSEGELATFLRKSSGAQILGGKSKEVIWDNISQKISDEEDKVKKVPIKIWRYTGMVAIITIIATFSILFLNQPDEVLILSSLGKTTEEILPDESKVFLNAYSSISFPEDWKRELTLDGEAFFEVPEGEAFLVKTDCGSVQVLGTSFNVFARDGDFEVSCKTGRVKVFIPKKSIEENLAPGQIISLKSDIIKRMDRSPELMGKWQVGEFYFNNQPIIDVFEELQRQFSIEIEFDGPENQIFSGYFTNKSLENALNMVCLPSGLQYQKTGAITFSVSANVR